MMGASWKELQLNIYVKFILILVKSMKDIIPCIVISSDILLDYFINYVQCIFYY